MPMQKRTRTSGELLKAVGPTLVRISMIAQEELMIDLPKSLL